VKKIYAPWRSNYVTENAIGKEENTPSKKCVFCKAFLDNNDEDNFILKRTKNCIVILNLYPYNAGHVMVLPIKHTETLEKLSFDVQAEMMNLISSCIKILKRALKPDGFNIGINLGKAGGAGMPSHLHIHAIPRWTGDTNFLPVIAETKAISFDLPKMYKQLKKAFTISK